MLHDLRKRLFPEDLHYRRWLRMLRIYALSAGLVAGSVDLVVDSLANGGVEATTLLAASITALVTILLVTGAFLASREIAQNNARRMIRRLEDSVIDGSLPHMPSLGWELFDRGREATLRLLEDRDEKIASLQRELEFYRPLAEDMPGLELLFDLDGRLVWANPAVHTLTGYSAAECLQAADPACLWVYAKDHGSLRAMLTAALQGEPREGQELRVQHRDGTLRWYACRWYSLRDAQGGICGIRMSAQDVQARKDAELKLLENVAALRRAQALKEHYLKRSNDERMRLAALLEMLSVGILFVDHDHRVVYANQRCAAMWGLGDRNDMVGVRDEIVLAKTGAQRVDNQAYLQHVEEVVSQQQENTVYDIYCSDGRVIRERSSGVPSAEGDMLIGRVWIFEDITETLQTQARLTELAERDPLTGLYNRRRFHEDLGRMLAESNRRKEALGLLIFDVDNFKDINEAHGHQSGDQMLCALATELRQVIRRNELLFRLGGDEFAILVAQPTLESVAYIARRVAQRAEQLRLEFNDEACQLSISIGVALAPLHAHDVDSLVQAADRALYQAKADGRNCWRMAFRWNGEEPHVARFISNAPETLQ
ncbi:MULTISPECIES: diguanylate cyclase [unclassified Uliginosibacterium]|uniref:sensor domain-containing diguanylate cyclase n=1 Tax=unclassified Uliginosibacterium TaxID=2621521 RepID=UPI000C7D1134|nr:MULTISPECIES: diguanylate cyclase [unclassified Uliginosibacterium]MDO6386329.1 diguanylate cyclase [Uliginosibacterium sp. 31-12]PLK49395.1 sensor domain-containing diguanylate cyclase [Uliginosibacterium sp. TH139]